jgi:GTP cyclohydrolase I
MKKEIMEDAIRMFLNGLEIDTFDQHLMKTPERVAKAWAESFGKGYELKVSDVLTVEFKEAYDEMIIVKDIPFYSMCAHHMIPFFGKAKIGYIPSGCVTGLSKLARVLDVYARRLQIQEQLTMQVASSINKLLKPKGVGVVLEAEHLCMTHRGVGKPGSMTITSCLLGAMRDEIETRHEFLNF